MLEVIGGVQLIAGHLFHKEGVALPPFDAVRCAGRVPTVDPSLVRRRRPPGRKLSSPDSVGSCLCKPARCQIDCLSTELKAPSTHGRMS